MSTDAFKTIPALAVGPRDAAERLRDRRYPIARWYLRPAAERLAAVLADSRVRPVHLTFCGLVAAGLAAGTLLWHPPGAAFLSAGLVLLWWFFDRADGLLARRQQTASAYGAWLDGNVDELVDVALHVAIAAAVAAETAGNWPWLLLAAFLAGKYLLMYGLNLEEGVPAAAGSGAPRRTGWLRNAYHLPGNADVRAHLLVLALATGWLTAELVLVAVYYNLRWIVRHLLVRWRLGGTG